MRTFTKTAAQGDVLFIRREHLPKGVKPVTSGEHELIVTHSETGHHHVMVMDREDEPNAQLYGDADNPLIAWLKINRPTALEHRRPFDTHEPIWFQPGIYEVRRQREYVPEGFRQVQD